ncbi:hypothetical protein DWW69_09780 [Bacteroides sp. AF16-49]|nr:hypothetical protein DXB63_07480 [Bacteroides sp. OM05-12]RHR75567.1 hypothetical protein DWW69_09780 [Bacteroides sp. AF16-49]
MKISFFFPSMPSLLILLTKIVHLYNNNEIYGLVFTLKMYFFRKRILRVTYFIIFAACFLEKDKKRETECIEKVYTLI